MNNTNFIRQDDLVNNPTARIPICLCLDMSGSMGAVEGDCIETNKVVYEDGQMWTVVEGGTTRLDKLKEGVELFYSAIRNDEVAKYSAEISIVSFNSTAVCLEQFSSVERQEVLPKFKSSGDTYMGEGVNLALDLLEERKQEYKNKGVDYYQPWLVLMSDGQPNGDSGEYARAIQRTQDLVKAKKLTVFPIGIGEEADMDALNMFSPNRPALRLQGLKFNAFFEWLSKSVSRTSQSSPSEAVKLDVTGIQGWAEL